MELENASIAAELSSSVPTNQINALLVLLRLYSAGKDVQNYVSTVIQSVLVKSNDPLVRKLCYQLIKGCTITNKYDWDFVVKEIVRDISNQTNNDLCVWALRSIVSLCGTAGQKFQEFFLRSQRQIEVITPTARYSHFGTLFDCLFAGYVLCAVCVCLLTVLWTNNIDEQD